MKLVKANAEKPLLDRRYLIPSVIAIGIIPLIMHEKSYSTHLDDEEWFAVGNSTAIDFFLFWKQWAVIILACVCLLILLVRAKYYYEELPWEKKAFIPALIASAFIFLSACFAKKPLFAFAGGYDMFQSALAVLSYLVIFYYTFSCIKSEEHVLYLLRWSEWFILGELVLCFFQAIGHDLIATKAGKMIVTDPSRWSNLDSFTLAPSVYGTQYNPDYLSMYLPVLIPVFIGLIIIEKKVWRKVFNAVLAVLSVYIQTKSALSGLLALAVSVVAVIFVLCSRRRQAFITAIVILAVLIVAGVVALGHSERLRTIYENEFLGNGAITNDSDIPVKEITTGTLDEGVTIELKNGKTVRFTFSVDDSTGLVNDFSVYDGDGNPLEMTLTDEASQTYTFADPDYAASNMYFYRNDNRSVTTMVFNIEGRNYFFSDRSNNGNDEEGRYWLLSTAGRCVQMPQKNRPEVAGVCPNGFWSGRGPIYNRTVPLLRHYLIIGAGADNFVMAYPQRDYVADPFIYGDMNALNVKPHSYYLQLWIQEGFIAFAAVMVFLFWYLSRSARLYRKARIHDSLSVMGLAVNMGVVAYLVAVIANDSNICTAPVFWTFLGLGWGINSLVADRKTDETD